VSEPDTQVFDFKLPPRPREAVDEWGRVVVLQPGDPLPANWYWRTDGKPERPEAA
jgi:hypothetical protein